MHSGILHRMVRSSKVPFLISMVITLGTLAVPLQFTSTTPHPLMSPPGISSTPLRLASLASAARYDEQVGVTFTQDFPTLVFNVSAVAYTDGLVGPGYLVNGLTDQGYWYQVGLSYNWPMTDGSVNLGFSMNYEVFDPSQRSIYPASGGGIQQFNGTINVGDSVQLSLSFSGRSVYMTASDWQTRSTASTSYVAYASSKVFIGLTSSLATRSGYFSGLMTEQYHYGSYFGTGSPVTYSVSGMNFSSAWMWMDEWNTDPNAFQLVFEANTTSPVSLSESVGHYFTSNGTAEIASSDRLVTGLTPVTLPTLVAGNQGGGRPGHTASVNLAIEDPQGATVKFENVTVVTPFGKYNFTLGTPFSFGSSAGQYSLTIIIPSNLALGTYNLTIFIMSWSYLDTQAQEWIPLQPGTLNEIFLATNIPPPSSPPSNPGSSPPSGSQGPSRSTQTTFSTSSLVSLLESTILPIAGAYAVLGVLAVALLLRQKQWPRLYPILGLRFCTNCGIEIALDTVACPRCSFPASIANNEPRSLPLKKETSQSVG